MHLNYHNHKPFFFTIRIIDISIKTKFIDQNHFFSKMFVNSFFFLVLSTFLLHHKCFIFSLIAWHRPFADIVAWVKPFLQLLVLEWTITQVLSDLARHIPFSGRRQLCHSPFLFFCKNIIFLTFHGNFQYRFKLFFFFLNYLLIHKNDMSCLKFPFFQRFCPSIAFHVLWTVSLSHQKIYLCPFQMFIFLQIANL